MGIKDVWTILQPYCERKPLYELQNKRVAVDLAGWVCQAQNIAEYQVQPKMYLRNLYFRTCFLLLNDVQTVYVLEGTAPSLKHKTMAARNALQFKGAEPRTKKSADGNFTKGRTRFNTILVQCKTMLSLMGLACISGVGEAEALCAYLDRHQLVDGCISQDSDCFAYGARVVYRNFSISMQGAQASAGGSVDVYDLQRAENELDFGRNKIIVLALLCGSDYNDGVHGVGKENALKFLAGVRDTDALERIRNWRRKTPHYERLAQQYDTKTSCSACGHAGRLAMHTKKGCVSCGLIKGCVPNEEAIALRHELQLRQKALVQGDFPDEELIGEFTKDKDTVQSVDLTWSTPDIAGFITFTVKYLQWEEVYAFAKLFPILTRWIVSHPRDNSKLVITKPVKIHKRRVVKGVASYEIVWNAEKLTPLIPAEQRDDKLFASIEPAELVQEAYPELVRVFEESKAKPKKAKKVKKNKTKSKTPVALRRFLTKSNDDSIVFDDVDGDDVDLSLIVEEIVAKGVPELYQSKITAIQSETADKRIQEASFFQPCWEENIPDPFEQSLYVQDISSSSSEDEDED